VTPCAADTELITRDRHDDWVLAPRSMGIRPRLRNQLGTRARCSRHQRPRYPPERHAGVGQRHEQQRSTDSWNPYTRFDPTYTAAANVTKLADAHTLRFGGAIDYQAM